MFILEANSQLKITPLQCEIPVNLEGKKATRYEHFYGKKSKVINHLRTWGEVGTIRIKRSMISKVEDRGIVCMLVRYAPSHDGDCYEMWDPIKGAVHTSRDVIWLKRMYYQRPDGMKHQWEEPNFQVKWTYEKEQDTVTPMKRKITFMEEMAGRPVEPQVTTKYGRTVKKPAKFGQEMGYMVVLTNAEETFYSQLQELQELSLYSSCEKYGATTRENDSVEIELVGAAEGDVFSNTEELRPIKYNEAMTTSDIAKWEEAVEEEQQKFAKYKVWETVPRNNVKANSKVLTSTWAMKKTQQNI